MTGAEQQAMAIASEWGLTSHPRSLVTSVLGVPVSRLPLEALLNLAVERIRAGRKTLFTTANAHSIVVAQRLPEFRSHFQQADAVLPDGVSTVWGVRASGGSIGGRVAGPDFFEAFLGRAEQSSLSIYLMGASDETLERLASRCRARWPRLVIKGTRAPPFGEISAQASEELVEAVNRARPDALFVAMTAPKQELWLSRYLRHLEVGFAMGVGAAFDFLAGNRRRAPRLVGQLGIEWLYRLLHEPRRLWRRNVDSAVFMGLLARAALRRRLLVAPSRREVGAGRADERASVRHAVRCRVTVGDRVVLGVNLSQGGLCLETDHALPEGVAVRGSIRLGGAELAFAGDVAWAVAGRRHEAALRMGVRFTDAPQGLAAWLEELGGGAPGLVQG